MKITFPRMGNYHAPISALLRNLFPDAEIIVPAPLTSRIAELGARHSPEAVCMPFKYTLGTFIDGLERGADTLLQGSGGCRFGYYCELQEEILRGLGYDFKFLDLFGGGATPLALYRRVRTLGCRLSFPRFVYYVLLATRSIALMDGADSLIRSRIGFQIKKNAFENLLSAFLSDIGAARTFADLRAARREYLPAFRAVPLNRPARPLRVGVIGELYELMEPYANFFLETELARRGTEVTRLTDATYLMFRKKRCEKRTMREAGGYLKYDIGADGPESAARLRTFARRGYDGVIHVKPFGCTPEVSAMPVLFRIGADYRIPVLYFSFDAQTSAAGILTRIEAFYDMLQMRKKARGGGD